MDHESWERIKSILSACLEVPEDEREARIESLCGGDLALAGIRGEILSSLGEQEAARASYARSLAIAESCAQQDALDMGAPLQMARAHAALGVLWARSDRVAEARQELSTALQLAQQLLANRPADVDGLALAKSAGEDLAVLAKCPDHGRCRPAKKFELPSLID